MGRLFEIVESYRKRFDPHPPSYSKVADEVGVTRQTLLNWRAPKELLDKEFLIALARTTHVPYSRVLDALLEDIGYLHEEQEVVSNKRRGRASASVTELRPAVPDALDDPVAADEGEGEPDVGAPEDDAP